MISRRNEAAERMFRAMQAAADAEGEFDMTRGPYAARFGISSKAVGDLTKRLRAWGMIAVVRQASGGRPCRYRLTGEAFAPAPPVRSRPINFVRHEVPSIVPDYPAPPSPCTYATARSMGIEPALTGRTQFTKANVSNHDERVRRPITLARVPSLERPLPAA